MVTLPSLPRGAGYARSIMPYQGTESRGTTVSLDHRSVRLLKGNAPRNRATNAGLTLHLPDTGQSSTAKGWGPGRRLFAVIGIPHARNDTSHATISSCT